MVRQGFFGARAAVAVMACGVLGGLAMTAGPADATHSTFPGAGNSKLEAAPIGERRIPV